MWDYNTTSPNFAIVGIIPGIGEKERAEILNNVRMILEKGENMNGNCFTTDDLDDEIYDYDSEEKERADGEIEALEREEVKERKKNEKEGVIEKQVDDEIERKAIKKTDEFIRSKLKEEITRMKLMNENLKKIFEILKLPTP